MQATCKDCGAIWNRKSRGHRFTGCRHCASMSVTFSPAKNGRPEKYPWDEWLRRLQHGEPAVILTHETPKLAQLTRGRLVRGRPIGKTMRVALRGNRVILRLVAA